MNKNKALFLDRDGTLIIDKHYLKDPEQVEPFLGVGEFLREAKACGYLLFLFTNQSGIGRGYYSMDDVLSCNRRMLELLNLPEDFFAEVCIAPELPTDPDPQVYRKPSPRFILEMIEKYDLNLKECWMIGDHQSDLAAGINAGINSAWMSTGKLCNDEMKLYMKENSIPELGALDNFFGLIQSEVR